MSPAPATVAQSQAQADSGRVDPNAKNAPAVRPAPFTRAAMRHREPFYDSGSSAIGANAVQVSSLDVPAFGYLRGIWLYVTATGGSGTSAVAKEDAPWSAIQSLQLADVNGAPIVGPLDGYDLFLANLFGVGQLPCDPRFSPGYQAVQTSGNFSFWLYVPVEIAPRDALGALPNQNAASTYKPSFNYGGLGNVYSANPTGAPDIRIRAWVDTWTQPMPTDLHGMPQATVPPAYGTAAFLTRTQITVAAGEQTLRFPRVGNVIRSITLTFRTTAPARSTAAFPDPFRLQLDGRIIENIGRDLQQHLQWAATWGPSATPAADASGNPTGVFHLSWNDDLIGKVGNEYRDLWLPTTQASKLELVGSFGSAGVLTVMTADVAPAGDYHLT